MAPLLPNGVRACPRDAERVPLKVWVGGLPDNISEHEIEKEFGKCGRVSDISIKYGKLDTFAFVTFADEDGYRNALDEMDQATVFGRRPIRVNHVLAKSSTDPTREGYERDRDDRGGSRGYDYDRDRYDRDRYDYKGGKGKDGKGYKGYKDRGGKGDYRRDRSYTPQRYRRGEDFHYGKGKDKGKGRSRDDDGHDNSRTVFVAGLPKDCREEELGETFAECGPIEDIALRTSKSGGLIAFIHYERERDSEDAIHKFHDRMLFGVGPVTVSRARGAPTAKDRSYKGGGAPPHSVAGPSPSPRRGPPRGGDGYHREDDRRGPPIQGRSPPRRRSRTRSRSQGGAGGRGRSPPPGRRAPPAPAGSRSRSPPRAAVGPPPRRGRCSREPAATSAGHGRDRDARSLLRLRPDPLHGFLAREQRQLWRR
eukprot:TRINITY_DN3583_c0_g1_i1.p1 TRINITY_DN3583_c0_g1~~TRINITY_DN3583_c0_g1_i1.p1  ORF type:complete len:423 (-),score=37.28 TRINITY_DN3583_c0_g1_i1:329-1597(-)